MTTDNAFLGGKLNILQPKTGYRAGADPVFLAAAVDAKPGQTVLDLGCGVGTAMLCLSARVADLSLNGVEIQECLARLARKNLARNSVQGTVFKTDVRAMPKELREMRFDHVMTNPPYFDRTRGSRAEHGGREQGRGEVLGLEVWVQTALRRVVPGGQLTMICRMERLPACLAAIGDKAGDVTVIPLAPRRRRSAKLFILQGIRGSKGAFSMRPPIVLHEGDRHVFDGENYTEVAQTILRDGGPLMPKD